MNPDNSLSNASTHNENETRRYVRIKYKELMEEIRKEGKNESFDVSESFEKADSLLSQVSQPREAIYDSTVMNMQCNYLKMQTQALHTNLTAFKAEEFTKKLITYLEKSKLGTPRKMTPLGSVDMWSRLGELSKKILATSPAFHYMFGTFEPGVVELKKRARKQKDKDDQTKAVERPKTINPNDQEFQLHTTVIAERTLSILVKLYMKNKGPICYFEFVTDPFSFSETVQNMFHVSILVKEGAVEIFPDCDGLPCIAPIPKDKISENKSSGNYSQGIISISVDEWKDIVNTFNITKPPVISLKKYRTQDSTVTSGTSKTM